MTGILEVQEFDTITCNPAYKENSAYRYLDEKYFKELDHFIREYCSDKDHTDATEFMKTGFKRNVGDTISFNSYVGIIELPSGFQIEVLPKISFDEDDEKFSKTKRVFLKMLSCLKEFEGKSFGDASLNADKMNLYEVFINMYLQETRNLVKRGLKSNYIPKEENLPFYKGKLCVGEHIKANIAHKERFFMRYDDYQVNRAENRLVKVVLLKLQKITRSMNNAKEIRQLLIHFEFVEASVNYEKDFSQVAMGRDTKDYEMLIQWAKVFLLNKSFTTFSGEKAGKALLFPMERVFEAFVARWIRSVFETESPDTRVSAQDSGYYLFDEPKKFRLRPDIVIKYTGTDAPAPVIMDTKWKKLCPNPSINYGISQADMYQMYAYSKKYHTPDIWLLYPYHPEVEGLGEISYKASEGELQDLNVRVFFVDLEHIEESVQCLQAKSLTFSVIS